MIFVTTLSHTVPLCSSLCTNAIWHCTSLTSLQHYSTTRSSNLTNSWSTDINIIHHQFAIDLQLATSFRCSCANAYNSVHSHHHPITCNTISILSREQQLVITRIKPDTKAKVGVMFSQHQACHLVSSTCINLDIVVSATSLNV